MMKTATIRLLPAPAMVPVMVPVMVLVMVLASCRSAGEAGLVPIPKFGDNPGQLTGYYHAPEDLPPGAPLVVVLHGCFQNAAEIARLSGWNELADGNGFAVLYPQQRFANNVARCFNWYAPEDIGRDGGEARSIRAMVSALADQLALDRTRVYVTGLSAGGALTAVMLATYPRVFQAGAIMSGMPYAVADDVSSGLHAMAGEERLSAQELAARVRERNSGFTDAYPALAIFQGTDDTIVDSSNADALTNQWGTLYGIDPGAPSRAEALAGNDRVQRTVYENGSGDTVLLRYDIAGLGHALAVDPGNGPRQGGAEGRFAKDMDFNATYWAAMFFGLVRDD